MKLNLCKKIWKSFREGTNSWQPSKKEMMDINMLLRNGFLQKKKDKLIGAIQLIPTCKMWKFLNKHNEV